MCKCFAETLTRGNQGKPSTKGFEMLGTILLIIFILLLLGAIPVWPYSRRWGWGGSGLLGLIVIILILAVIFGWF